MSGPLGHGDDMKWAVFPWECSETVPILLDSLLQVCPTMVGLAFTSTHHSVSTSGVLDLACVKEMLLNFWVDPAQGGDNIEVSWWFESIVQLFPTLYQAHHGYE